MGPVNGAPKAHDLMSSSVSFAVHKLDLRHRAHRPAPRSRFLAGGAAASAAPLETGLGTHYAYLWVGTPPQRQTVILDTGSYRTGFPCDPCSNCGDYLGASNWLLCRQRCHRRLALCRLRTLHFPPWARGCSAFHVRALPPPCWTVRRFCPRACAAARLPRGPAFRPRRVVDMPGAAHDVDGVV